MLSFLKDRFENNSTVNNGDQSNCEQNDSDSRDYLKPAEHGKSLKQSTMILAILFAVGGVCLWVMIKKAAPQAVAAEVNTDEMQIENAIAQITGIQNEVGKEVDGIVDRFCDSSSAGQISVHNLRKNPFKHDLSLRDITDDAQDEGKDHSISRELFREELKSRARRLQLLSIMESPKGSCCMIDDKILYQGDTIEGFTIAEISSDAVVLSQNNVKIQLKMSE